MPRPQPITRPTLLSSPELGSRCHYLHLHFTNRKQRGGPGTGPTVVPFRQVTGSLLCPTQETELDRETTQLAVIFRLRKGGESFWRAPPCPLGQIRLSQWPGQWPPGQKAVWCPLPVRQNSRVQGTRRASCRETGGLPAGSAGQVQCPPQGHRGLTRTESLEDRGHPVSQKLMQKGLRKRPGFHRLE